MKTIIPLAGPDFVRPDGSVKAELDVNGTPLLRCAIESRSWWRDGRLCDRDLVFVLLDQPSVRSFAERALGNWYPSARAVFLTTSTEGALLSTLAGVSLLAQHDEPICIDLADILFDEDAHPELVLSNEDCGGLALTFPSNRDIYSYFRRDKFGAIVEAVEKRVISDEASAGVYFFKSPAVYLRAVAHSLDHRGELAYRERLFVCPAMNGVLAQGLRVEGYGVRNVVDIKLG